MPTMTVTITNVPTFAAVGIGYKFTGTVNLPKVVNGGIKINSMKLYYGKGRTYVVGPYLTAVCGDTTFRTDYFTISETGKSSVKERNLNIIGTIVAGDDHILRQNGREIIFTVARDTSTSAVVIDRPYAGDMTLTVDYTILQSGLTLDKTSVDAGQPIGATITAGNAAYAHKLTFTAGSRSETLELEAGVGSTSYTIPMDWLEEIPRATELQATATLETYSGEELMGSESKAFTILCPADVVPTCEITAEPVNGFEGLYLGGRSSVALAIVNEQGLYGAQVVGYQLTGAGRSEYLKSATFGPLTQGDNTFTATVTDTRGRTGKAQVTVNVLPYISPSLTNVSIYRSNAQGVADGEGAWISAQATAVYSAAEGANSAILQARYRTANGSWSAWENMESGVTHLLGSGALLETVSYEAQIRVTDEVGNSASFMQRIPTSQVAFNIKEGGSAAAFGQYAEKEKALSIPEDWRFYRGEVDIEQKADDAREKADEAYELAEEAKNSTPTVSMLDAYPVGSIYMSSVATSPAELFGGTWTQITDKFLMAAGDTYAAGTEGGRESVTLSAAIGAGNDDIKSLVYVRVGATDYQKANLTSIYRLGVSSSSTSLKKWNHSTPVTETTGTERKVNIIPPYQAVYVWQRTA